MEKYRQKIGEIGEKKAQNYLKCRGYEILECNFRTKSGELDIIAKEKECIVFVEVKTRTNQEYGAPSEAVSYYKRKHMYQSARHYLKRFSIEVECRFDVMEVTMKRQGFLWVAKIEHLKNVIQ